VPIFQKYSFQIVVNVKNIQDPEKRSSDSTHRFSFYLGNQLAADTEPASRRRSYRLAHINLGTNLVIVAPPTASNLTAVARCQLVVKRIEEWWSKRIEECRVVYSMEEE